MKITEKIRKYLNMPHSITIKQDDGGFFVTISDLPGCMSQGDTLEETYAMIMDAKATWIEAALKKGEPIPEPSEEKKHGGRILLRIPSALHVDLTNRAREQGVSLNHYLSYLLTKEQEREKSEEKIQLHLHSHTSNYKVNLVGTDVRSWVPTRPRKDVQITDESE